MDTYIQAVGLSLVAVVLCLLLGQYNKNMTLLLTLAACAMVFGVGVFFLEPVVELLTSLQEFIGLDSGYMQIILKAVGVGMIGELVALLCADAGNAALGKTVELLTAAAVLWLSVPLFTELLELIQRLMGEL